MSGWESNISSCFKMHHENKSVLILSFFCSGVVQKWRHEILNNFWPPSVISTLFSNRHIYCHEFVICYPNFWPYLLDKMRDLCIFSTFIIKTLRDYARPGLCTAKHGVDIYKDANDSKQLFAVLRGGHPVRSYAGFSSVNWSYWWRLIVRNQMWINWLKFFRSHMRKDWKICVKKWNKKAIYMS